PGLPGVPGMSRSANAATVSASASLRKAPCPSQFECVCADTGTFAAAGGRCVCPAASGSSLAPAATPAPNAAPARNPRRATPCLLMIASSALLPDFRDGPSSGSQDALLWFFRQAACSQLGRCKSCQSHDTSSLSLEPSNEGGRRWNWKGDARARGC